MVGQLITKLVTNRSVLAGCLFGLLVDLFILCPNDLRDVVPRLGRVLVSDVDAVAVIPNASGRAIAILGAAIESKEQWPGDGRYYLVFRVHDLSGLFYRLQGLTDDPELAPIAWHVRGVIYQELVAPRLALRSFAQVMLLDPAYDEGYIDRGFTYLGLGDFAAALAEFDAAVALDPRNPNAYPGRAVAHQRQGHLDDAIRDYQAFLDQFPQSPRRQEIEQRIEYLRSAARGR